MSVARLTPAALSSADTPAAGGGEGSLPDGLDRVIAAELAPYADEAWCIDPIGFQRFLTQLVIGAASRARKAQA